MAPWATFVPLEDARGDSPSQDSIALEPFDHSASSVPLRTNWGVRSRRTQPQWTQEGTPACEWVCCVFALSVYLLGPMERHPYRRESWRDTSHSRMYRRCSGHPDPI